MSRALVTWLMLLLCATGTQLTAAEITPATRKAFERYVNLFETNWRGDLQGPRFLWLDGNPGEKTKAHAGEIRIVPRKTLDRGAEVKPPDGMIQDWLGAMFLPNTTIERVRLVMQDYKNYQTYFRPEVVESKLIAHHGDDFEVYLRLYKRHVLTVVLNTTYSIRYASTGPAKMHIVSRSTRVAEVTDAKRSSEHEEPPGNDNGYLWALNSYWRFEQADGGVYAECEAISLSRDVPLGLGWAIKGFLDKFPKDSMDNTLGGLKRAVISQPGAAQPGPAQSRWDASGVNAGTQTARYSAP